MEKKKSNKINSEDAKKEKIGKWAAAISAVFLSIALICFFAFGEKVDSSYLAAENYYSFVNSDAEFEKKIEGKDSPYLLFYYFDKYKETKDVSYLEKIISKNYIFYSDMARIIYTDKLINENEVKQAENILSSVREKEFLAVKYYFSGLVNEKQDKISKAKDYYQLVINFENADMFLKELSSLRMSFLK